MSANEKKKKLKETRNVPKVAQREVHAVCGINMKVDRGVSITRERKGLIANVWVSRKPIYDAALIGIGIVAGLVVGWLL